MWNTFMTFLKTYFIFVVVILNWIPFQKTSMKVDTTSHKCFLQNKKKIQNVLCSAAVFSICKHECMLFDISPFHKTNVWKVLFQIQFGPYNPLQSCENEYEVVVNSSDKSIIALIVKFDLNKYIGFSTSRSIPNIVITYHWHSEYFHYNSFLFWLICYHLCLKCINFFK